MTLNDDPGHSFAGVKTGGVVPKTDDRAECQSDRTLGAERSNPLRFHSFVPQRLTVETPAEHALFR